MFGKSKPPQNEKTLFLPRSVYAISKVFAYHSVIHYREAYKIHACNGILFNHESPRRGVNFVTRKIVQGLIRIKNGKQKTLTLGNLYAKRDWGHAEDYVEAMWKILQQKKPGDFVIATGKQYSIKQFVMFVAKELKMKIGWKGRGINEKAYLLDEKKIIIECDKEYIRPLDVNTLLGDASKARKELKWKPKINIKQLVKEMVTEELKDLDSN